MQQHAQTLRSQASHEKYDAASVREQMSFLHEDVTGILRNVLDRRLSSRRYPPVEEAIDNATSSFKKARVKWRIETSVPDYSPLCKSQYCIAEQRHGTLYKPDKTNTTAHTAHVVGLVVPFDFDSAQSDVHEVFGTLYHYLHPTLAIFPQPITIQTDTNGDITFCFLDAPSVSLLSVCDNKVFYRKLRQHFFVIAAWCRQLAYLLHVIAHTDQALVVPPKIKDVYITQDGMLTIGNVVLSPREPTEESRRVALSEYRSFAHDVLATALGTSRLVPLYLCPPHRNPLVDRSPMRQQLQLAEGCDLYLSFTDRGSRLLHVYSVDTEQSVLDQYPVLLCCDDVSILVRVAACGTKVEVRGLHPGTATITVTRSLTGPPLHIITVEVFNVSDSAVPEVNELCGLLNETCIHGVAVFECAAYCYSNDEMLTAPDLIARDWTELAFDCRVIDTLPDEEITPEVPVVDEAREKRKNKKVSELKKAEPTAQELALAALAEDMQEIVREETIRDMVKNKGEQRNKGNRSGGTPWK